jgi:hypothetical protein
MRHLARVLSVASALISPGSRWLPTLSPAYVLGADPWHDYLALPLAPLVLLVQIGALFVRPWRLRWGISVACMAGITAMFVYVDSLPERPGEGANIGAGVLLLWLLVSLVLVLVLVARDSFVVAFRVVRSRFAKPSH